MAASKPLQIRSVGIVGAGLMGRSIAALNLARGLDVVLTDADPAALDVAAAAIDSQHPPQAWDQRARLDRRSPLAAPESSDDLPSAKHAAGSGRFAQTDDVRRTPCPWPPSLAIPPSDQHVRRLRLCRSIAGLADCDLVIEAVPEILAVKQHVFDELSGHLKPEAILATNTSALPLSHLVGHVRSPERFCGLHFCHPVGSTRAVEVIRGRQTGAWAIAELARYARRLGRVPIVIEDSPGGIVNRLLQIYLNEALELLRDGATIDAVETAATQFGMPWGPFTQLDEIGLDVALRAGMHLCLAYSERMIASPLLVALYKRGALGRKTGLGFFSYDETGTKGAVSPAVEMLIRRHRRTAADIGPAEITWRMFLPMLTEAVRVLESEVARKAADVDTAVVHGIGFPAKIGGILRWWEQVGGQEVLRQLALREALGPRFRAPETLRKLASLNAGFYS